LIEWLNDWMIEWLIDWLIDWLNNWLIEWLIDWMIEWLNDWMIYLFICLLHAWLKDWLIHFLYISFWWPMLYSAKHSAGEEAAKEHRSSEHSDWTSGLLDRACNDAVPSAVGQSDGRPHWSLYTYTLCVLVSLSVEQWRQRDMARLGDGSLSWRSLHWQSQLSFTG